MNSGVKAALFGTLVAMAGSPAQAVVVQWTTGPGANNHYYELVTGDFSFAQSLANSAVAAPIAGFSSHLVTITSANENSFLVGLFSSPGAVSSTWAAGSDAANEGVWQWIAGPETGQTFWNNGTTLIYANWNAATGEPNNVADEDFLRPFQFGSVGTWNDAQGGAGSNYIVEWSQLAGAVPEPATWAMMILGFGLVGGAMRYGKRSTRVAFAAA